MRILYGLLVGTLVCGVQAGEPRPWWLSIGAGIGEVEVVGHDRSALVSMALAEAGYTTGGVLAGEDDATRTRSLAAGYRFNPYIGLSAAYQDLGETDGDFVAQSAVTRSPQIQGSTRSRYTAWSVAGTAYWPALSWLSLQARLGLHYWQHEFELRGNDAGGADIDQRLRDAGTGLLCGAGIGFSPLAWLGIDLYWERFHGIEGEPGIDVRSISAVFRF